MDEAGMGDGLQEMKNRDDGSLLFFGFDDFACEFHDKTPGQVLDKPLALSRTSSWSSLSSFSSDSSLEDDWDSPPLTPPLETLPRVVMVQKAREERLVICTEKPKKKVGKRFLQWLKQKLRCGCYVAD